MSLGVIYTNEKHDIERAEQYFLNVYKHDNPKAYAIAQLNLGLIYEEKKHKIEQAERYYLNIERQDDPEVYVAAQFYLGFIYQNKGDIDQAERCYLNVAKRDNPEAYAQAQLNLGVINQNVKHNIEMAEHYYLKVEVQDNPEVYAQAQLNLGVIYHNEKYNIKQAEQYYLNVKEKDNTKAYAQAQLNLGVIYQNVKHNIKQAEQYYINIKKDDNSEVYAAAQFNLGIIYQDKQDIKQAEQYYINIKKEDNSEVYAAAQFNLGIIYQDKQDIKQKEQYYSNIEKQDNPKIYAELQRKLGDDSYFNKTTANLKPAEEYYRNLSYSDYWFKDYIIAQIMLSVISNKDVPKFRDEKERNNLVVNPICKIRKFTRDIQNELFVTFRINKNLKSQKQQFERQVAHYTKPEVVFNLLKNKPSDFRLNVVDFMNDPTENQVLTDWLGVNTVNNDDIKTFLASFSFNHNSLNQFRLYGNENNIVGSSISVVFNQEFWGKNIKRTINSESINSLFKYENLSLQQNVLAKKTVTTMGINDLNESLNHKNDKTDKTENDLKENSVQKNSATVVEKNITSSFGFLPLFRCLYFDPKNGYISIAKRNKYSFYLEHQNDSPENIDAKWNNYLGSLNEEAKINTVRKKLNQIQKIICRLKKSRKVREITNLEQLIALALMPISCLVKHAAFEDEDECRMIYITNIADDLIQAPTNYAYANSLFVNYGKIEDYLEKIYLGPQCQPHHKLWITNHVRTSQSKTRSKPIKVVQSEMPLR